MKFSKKRYVIIGLIVLFYFLRGIMYRTFITYRPVKERKGYAVHDAKLIRYIENSTVGNDLLTITSIVNISNELVSKKLKFTSSSCDVDPNKSISSIKTHCVGYAYFFESTCNYLLKKSALSGEWKAKTCAGKLYFLGVDIHTYFDSPFFKDHDFVIVENSVTGEKIFIDPTISDYLGIDEVSERSN